MFLLGASSLAHSRFCIYFVPESYFATTVLSIKNSAFRSFYALHPTLVSACRKLISLHIHSDHRLRIAQTSLPWKESSKRNVSQTLMIPSILCFLPFKVAPKIQAIAITWTLRAPIASRQMLRAMKLSSTFVLPTPSPSVQVFFVLLEQRQSVSVAPLITCTELFEKLYLSPQTPVKGNLRNTFGNPTPVALLGFVLACSPLACELMGWRGAGGNGSATLGSYYFVVSATAVIRS